MGYCNTGGGVSTTWSKRPFYAQAVKNTAGYAMLAGTGASTLTSFYYLTTSASAYNSIYSGSTVQAPSVLEAIIMRTS